MSKKRIIYEAENTALIERHRFEKPMNIVLLGVLERWDVYEQAIKPKLGYAILHSAESLSKALTAFPSHTYSREMAIEDGVLKVYGENIRVLNDGTDVLEIYAITETGMNQVSIFQKMLDEYIDAPAEEHRKRVDEMLDLGYIKNILGYVTEEELNG